MKLKNAAKHGSGQCPPKGFVLCVLGTGPFQVGMGSSELAGVARVGARVPGACFEA